MPHIRKRAKVQQLRGGTPLQGRNPETRAPTRKPETRRYGPADTDQKARKPRSSCAILQVDRHGLTMTAEEMQRAVGLQLLAAEARPALPSYAQLYPPRP